MTNTELFKEGRLVESFGRGWGHVISFDGFRFVTVGYHHSFEKEVIYSVDDAKKYLKFLSDDGKSFLTD